MEVFFRVKIYNFLKYSTVFMFLFSGALSLMTNTTWAMEFRRIVLKDGIQAILAEGDITVGDARKLEVALQTIERERLGTKILFLVSYGGLVDEAFKMANIIENVGVTAVVDRMPCASSCAMVLFISARYRYVTKGGSLGLHTCYLPSTKEHLPLCNERIKKHALKNGVPWGIVAASTKYKSATQMNWFNADEAECWGFTRYPLEVKNKNGSSLIGTCAEEMISEMFGPNSGKRSRRN